MEININIQIVDQLLEEKQRQILYAKFAKLNLKNVLNNS